ncbi:MAG: hypothetical protein QOG46_619 [Pseudonocardiales bacterium]|jgi:hypothetical protein|nr:hypothetical protein [Pseudonocardiales bacterium]
MAGEDQQCKPATGRGETTGAHEWPDPPGLSPPLLASGPAPQGLPGISGGVQRDTGGWIRNLELRSARYRRWRRCFCPHPVTQGAQLLDREDLVTIRFVHNVV